MSEEAGSSNRRSASADVVVPESPLPPTLDDEGCCDGACTCAFHPPPPAEPCLGFAAPVRMVHNPSYNPANLRPAQPQPPANPHSFFYPTMYATFQSFPLPDHAQVGQGPLVPQNEFHCFLAPDLPQQTQAQRTAPRPPAAAPPTRSAPKRPPPRETSSLASDDEIAPSAVLAEEDPVGVRTRSSRVPTSRKGRLSTKALRISAPTRSHSTSELCLEESDRHHLEEEEDAVFAPVRPVAAESRSEARARKSSRAGPSSSELIDLTFHSDEDLSPDDDVSVIVPSDRATVGSSSVHGSEQHFGENDDVEVVQFEEGGPVPQTADVPPCDFTQRQQVHVAPIASPRLQSASSQLHHGYNCNAFPVQNAVQPCPHSQCFCHLRPRAPCSYWTGGCPAAAAIYCHHHHIPRGAAPCPLHSPCPHPCPFEPARPQHAIDDFQQAPPIRALNLVPPPQPSADQQSASNAALRLRHLQQTGLIPYSVHLPSSQAQPTPTLQSGARDKAPTDATSSHYDQGQRQPAVHSRHQLHATRERRLNHNSARPPSSASPHVAPNSCRQGTGSTRSQGGRPMTQGHMNQMRVQGHQQSRHARHPQGQIGLSAAPWAPTLQQPAINIPLMHRNHYQAQIQQMATQREAQNRWFDSRRQRHPAGSAAITYAAPAPPAAVQANSILTQGQATLNMPQNPDPQNTAMFVAAANAAEVAAATAANYQRHILAQRSNSPIVYSQYPYAIPQTLARTPAPPTHHHQRYARDPQTTTMGGPMRPAGQISIVVSPSAQGLPAQHALASLGGAGALMTASLPMQLDWNLFALPQHPTPQHFLMQQLGAEFPGVAGAFTLQAAADPQPVGASLHTIERHTKKAAWEPKPNVPLGEEERCTVCLSEFEANETIRTLSCEHLFHSGCIDRWLTYNKKCPVCRVEVDKRGTATTASSSRAPVDP